MKVAATASAQDRAAARSLRDPITDAVRQRLAALKLRRHAVGVGPGRPQEPLMHADRTNRIMLLLLALLLLAVGLDAGAASIGVYGTATEHSHLMDNPTGHFIGAHGVWLWPVAAVAALIIALLALRWLIALLFSTDRSGDLLIHSGTGAGRTTLANGALTDAVVAEIEGYRGVNSARARLIGDRDDPELVVTAVLEETADFTALRQRIETEALTHARQALGNMSLPTQLDLTITSRARRPGRLVARARGGGPGRGLAGCAASARRW